MKLILLTFFISFNLFAQERVKVRETNLNVAIGIDETIKLDYKYRTKVKLAREDLVQLILAPSKQEITFRGVKAGRVSVTIYDAAGEQRDKFIVNVTSDGNSNTVRELRELLGDIEGLKISIKGGKVIVDGEIVVPNQIGRVTTVMSKYPDVLLLIEYSKQTQLIVAREMQDAVNKNNMKDVTVRVVNGDYWLEGVVNSVPKKDLANDIANAYLPDTLSGLGQAAGGNRFQGRAKGAIANFINVNEKKDPEPPPKLIKVSSQFVELSKDYLKVFAFKWAPFMSNESSISFGKNEAGGISTDESGTLSGTISRLFPKLQSAKQADISFQMTTVPKISNQENVELKDLNVSVSLPNGTSGSGTPQVTTNEVRTNLTVKSKESAVIGGIMQSNSATNYDKNDPDPVTPSSGDEDTGQASTLFNLLRSKSYTTGKSQFVVFVTPEILESASKGTEEIRRKFRKRER
jgi:pilus assembly protein CpaC